MYIWRNYIPIAMKSILTVTLLLFLSVQAFFAQAQNDPGLPELNVTADYLKSEALFLQVTEWLTETDLDKQLALRMRNNAFVMKWIEGVPYMKMSLSDQVVSLFDNNSQLLPIYMANYASFCIGNKENKNALDAAKAGFLAVVKVYKKDIGIQKNKALDKLAAAADRNKLDKYIIKHLTITLRY